MRINAAGRSAIRHRRIFCSAAMTPSPALLIASATRAWPTARRLDAKKSLLRSREKVARAARLWCTTGVRGRDGDLNAQRLLTSTRWGRRSRRAATRIGADANFDDQTAIASRGTG